MRSFTWGSTVWKVTSLQQYSGLGVPFPFVDTTYHPWTSEVSWRSSLFTKSAFGRVATLVYLWSIVGAPPRSICSHLRKPLQGDGYISNTNSNGSVWFSHAEYWQLLSVLYLIFTFWLPFPPLHIPVNCLLIVLLFICSRWFESDKIYWHNLVVLFSKSKLIVWNNDCW